MPLAFSSQQSSAGKHKSCLYVKLFHIHHESSATHMTLPSYDFIREPCREGSVSRKRARSADGSVDEPGPYRDEGAQFQSKQIQQGDTGQ